MGYNLKKKFAGGSSAPPPARELGKKYKGERTKEENYIKNGGKGLKTASFWAIISKKSRGGLPTPPLGS